jgi:hypothetical protein
MIQIILFFFIYAMIGFALAFIVITRMVLLLLDALTIPVMSFFWIIRGSKHHINIKGHATET